jgi:hypothetical protein
MRRNDVTYRHFSDEEIEKANSVDILALAKSYGYEPEKSGKKALHLKKSGGLYIFPESNKYYHHTGSDADKKGGAVDFVMREDKLSFGEAVAKLLGEDYVVLRTEHRPTASKPKEPLVLPEKAANFKRAYWYLVSVRGIEPEIVSHFMNQKMIYQEVKHGNTVFVGYDGEGTAKYCSMRASRPDSEFKIDVENSDKSYPFCHEGQSDLVIVNESPIDMMSHATLTKLCGGDWKQDHRISLGCLSTAALDRYLEAHSGIKKIVIAYDNDYLSRDKDGHFANWGQLAADKCVRKYSKRGFDCAIHTPYLKDFNLQLTETRKGCTKEDMDRQRMNELEAEFDKDSKDEPETEEDLEVG